MNENNLKNEEKLEETSKVNAPKRKSIFSFILVFLLGALVAVAVCVLIYTYKAKELPREEDIVRILIVLLRLLKVSA